MSSRPHPAFLVSLVILVELAWSGNAVASKYGLLSLSPLGLAAFRLVAAGLVALPIFFLAPRRMRILRIDWPILLMLGLFGMALNQACFTIGLNYTTVGHSSVIVSFGPVFVLLLACATRLESLTRAKLAGMVISLSGVAILAAEYGLNWQSKTLPGDLLTLVGSLCFSIYVVLGKGVVERYDTVTMVCSNHIFAGILWLPVAAREGHRLHWAAVGWLGWASVIYLASFGSVGAYLVYYWALHHMPASRLAAFSYLLPFNSTALGVLLFAEPLTKKFLLGGALVLVGVYLSQRGPGAIRSLAN